MAGPIRNIDNRDINKITSGQVIIELKSIIKELIENSVDAGSRSIEITFNNYGIDEISVQDNGSGISPSDFASVCLRNHTSKLSNFEDLQSLTSLGFRGEALNSICSVSESLRITTVQQSNEEFNKIYTLSYDSMGNLANESFKLTKQASGTSVVISKLFYNLPVRYKNFIKNSKKEFHKSINFIINYMLVYPNIKFNVVNVTNNKKAVILNSKGGENTSVLDNMITIFGADGAKGLIPMDIEIDEKISLEGFISDYSFGYGGRSSSDRQFLFVNKRPVVCKKISKMITECYKQFNHLQCPVFILNLQINPNMLDVNLTPDKTKVLIHNEDHVVQQLKDAITYFLDSRSNISIPKSNMKIEERLTQEKSIPSSSSNEQEVSSISSSIDVQIAKGDCSPCKQQEDQPILDYEKRDTSEQEIEEHFEETAQPEERSDGVDTKDMESSSVYNSTEPSQYVVQTYELIENTGKLQSVKANLLDTTSEPAESPTTEVRGSPVNELPNDIPHQTSTEEVIGTTSLAKNNEPNGVENVSESESPVSLPVQDDNDFKEIEEQNIVVEPEVRSVRINEVLRSKPKRKLDIRKLVSSYRNENDDGKHSNFNDNYGKNFYPAEDDGIEVEIGDQEWWQPSLKRLKRNELHNVCCKLNIDKNSLQCNVEDKHDENGQNNITIDDISKTQDQEAKLSYTIHKSDFLKMKLVGQFNLGFILVSLSKEGCHNLFIIDQHASDEKYNFERLIKNFEINYQSLVQPQTVELSIIDEILVLDNKDVFERNGFKFEIDEEQKCGKRIKLTAIPYSKGHTFNLQDFNELINLLNDNGNNRDIKCQKIRSLCAMKACRSLIMIGQSLLANTMTRVVENLSKLNKPWNCPHGRPTMRHLIELNHWKASNFPDYKI